MLEKRFLALVGESMKIDFNHFYYRNELLYISRYLGGGVINTIVGFSVIFLVMALGGSPEISNVTGYSVGFLLGFFITKKMVFQSEGAYIGESIRYLVAFFISFLFNFLLLKLAMTYVSPYISQILAAAGYSFSMYLLVRVFVFSVED